MPDLPAGTVTLVFTDIEDSTGLLRELRGAYGTLLADHATILRNTAREHGGVEVDTEGDSFFFVFTRVGDAVEAVAAAQRLLHAQRWPSDARLRVRIGIHTGEPAQVDGRYVGLDVHRAARICAAAHGGQVLLSATTAALADQLELEQLALLPLEPVTLTDGGRPERLSQLVIDGLDSEFPPLRMDVEQAIALEPMISATEPAADSSTREFEVSLLGPVSVFRAGDPQRISAQKHRMVVAVLALRLGEVVSADTLIDMLWDAHPPATAAKALQVYVSELRKLIEDDPRLPTRITSHPPGYRMSLPPAALDLRRFESLWEAGREALHENDPQEAKRLLDDALGLWRGDPLSDMTYIDAFAADIRRLDELRVACMEDRGDAELACGNAAAMVAELEDLTNRYPLRERLRAQLMLALYRAGRQSDALAAYHDMRTSLVDELGIDPSPDIAKLERQILQHDPELQLATTDASGASDRRTLVAVSQSDGDVDALCRLGEAITLAGTARALVIARVLEPIPGVDSSAQLGTVTQQLTARRDVLAERGVNVRVAAFSSSTPAADIVKLTAHQDADILVVDGTRAILDGRFGLVDELLRETACDVALHLPHDSTVIDERIVVPFSGSEHDWAALELAALLARSRGGSLALLGVESDDGRNASRLLATASLVIQRVSAVVAEPVLVSAGAPGIVRIAQNSHVVTGLSSRFREEGLGETRFHLARNAQGPVTFVRKGTRPGVLAPPHTITRYTWSLMGRATPAPET